MFHRKFLLLTRRKISFFVLPFLIISAIFILYQVSIFVQLSKESNLKRKPNLIRGTHEQEASFYKAEDNQFTCIRSMEKIDFKRINDNYCDCLDGSDEPGTNACKNGLFHCGQETTKKFPPEVHSSKVNDGICDCCDGSDEWRNVKTVNINRTLQRKLGRYQVPCPNLC